MKEKWQQVNIFIVADVGWLREKWLKLLEYDIGTLYVQTVII